MKILNRLKYIPLPFLFILTFIGAGFALNYLGEPSAFIARKITDCITIIGLNISLAWMLIKLFNEKKVDLFVLLVVALTNFMFLIHDLFNFSTINNNLCDAGWNLITLLWVLCIINREKAWKE